MRFLKRLLSFSYASFILWETSPASNTFVCFERHTKKYTTFVSIKSRNQNARLNSILIILIKITTQIIAHTKINHTGSISIFTGSHTIVTPGPLPGRTSIEYPRGLVIYKNKIAIARTAIINFTVYSRIVTDILSSPTTFMRR